jgi:hypothetical protein
MKPNKNQRQKAGHYEILGETIAKFEFFEAGWNSYQRYLDVDKVDFILRSQTGTEIKYREVQVKYGKLYDCGSAWERALFDVTSWRFFRADEFREYAMRKDFFLTYVLAHSSGYKGDIFIFPIREFHHLLQKAAISGDKRKVYISRSIDNPHKWFFRIQNRFNEISADTCIDVTGYRRNFSLLKSK